MTQLFIPQFSPLSSEYISGEVKKSLVYRSSDTEVAVLRLAPGAAIAEHKNPNENVIYFVFEHGFGELCPIGSSLGMENATVSPMFILSIETNNKVQLNLADDGLKQFVQST